MANNEQNTVALEHVLAEIARRSAIDPDFRSLALRDSKAAIMKVGGSPYMMEVKFIDNTGPVKTIPLPDPLLTEDLSEFDLENVAGGTAATVITTPGSGWSRG